MLLGRVGLGWVRFGQVRKSLSCLSCAYLGFCSFPSKMDIIFNYCAVGYGFVMSGKVRWGEVTKSLSCSSLLCGVSYGKVKFILIPHRMIKVKSGLVW